MKHSPIVATTILGAALALPLCGLPGGARAQGANADPAAPIVALQKSIEQMEHASGSFAAKEEMIAPAVDRAFDLETILRNSVGLRYASIPPDAKQHLLATFRTYTLANYVSNFAGGDSTFTVSPQTRQSGTDVIVQTSINPASGSPTRVDYVMRPSNGGYKAVDVLLDGTTSRVAVQRSDFRAALQQGGAAGLEQTLQRKIATLSGG